MKRVKKFAVLLSVISIMIGMLILGDRISKEIAARRVYKDALNLIHQGDYIAAGDSLNVFIGYMAYQNTGIYKKATALRLFAEAENAKEQQQYIDANRCFNRLEVDDLEEDLREIYMNDKPGVEAEAKIMEELERIKAEKAEAEKLASNPPFMGMSESDIDNTVLGKAVLRGHNLQCINGNQYTANIYDYYSGGKAIYTVRCVRGRVYNMWDARDPDKLICYNTVSGGKVTVGEIVYTSYQKKYRNGGGSSTTKNKSSSSDPYNASSYSNEEDFYYDHYDDFFDFEDAEDYWNEHH